MCDGSATLWNLYDTALCCNFLYVHFVHSEGFSSPRVGGGRAIQRAAWLLNIFLIRLMKFMIHILCCFCTQEWSNICSAQTFHIHLLTHCLPFKKLGLVRFFSFSCFWKKFFWSNTEKKTKNGNIVKYYYKNTTFLF